MSDFKTRSDYKGTWNQLSSTLDDAKLNVAGSLDEADFERTGTDAAAIVADHAAIKPTDVVLEIGCGVGRIGKALAPKCGTWIGTDVAGNMLKHASERLKDLPNVQFVEISGLGLQEIPDASVDVVYCAVVFMHLLEWDRYRYVLDAFRVLRPGGRCFVDNADIASPHGWKLFMSSYNVPVADRAPNLSMVSSGDELQAYFIHAGYTEIQVHRWHDAWVGVVGVKP